MTFNATDWQDVYEMVKYGGAQISYSPNYIDFVTKAIQGTSGIDPSTGLAVGTTSILLRSNYFSAHPVKDFEATVTFKNIKFTRIGTPNGWEGCLWIAFNASTTSDKPWNYFALKTTGLEAGTAFNQVGQKYWATNGSTVKFPQGQAFTVVIKKVGRSVSLKVNGVVAWSGTIPATDIYDVPGTFDIYTEDGEVAVSQFDVKSLD